MLIVPKGLPQRLTHALNEAARAAASTTAPWWIIGSAAMALHGLRLSVADVDLLLTPDDATRLLAERGSVTERTGEVGPFRSDVFGRWTDGSLPVDVMGGFHVRREGRWVEVRPTTRVAVELDGGAVFVPAVAELASIARLMGRPKDMRRAGRLECLRER